MMRVDLFCSFYFENYSISYGELSKKTTEKQKYKYFLKINSSGRLVDPEHLKYVQELYDKCE